MKDGPKCVNKLVAALKTGSQSNLSRRLSVLRSVGGLSTHRQGMESIYEIANPKIVGNCELMRTILADGESYQMELLHLIQDRPEE